MCIPKCPLYGWYCNPLGKSMVVNTIQNSSLFSVLNMSTICFLQAQEADSSNQLTTFFQNKILTPDDPSTLNTRYPMPNLKQMIPFKPAPRGTGKYIKYSSC